jgi:hypothetical protein
MEFPNLLEFLGEPIVSGVVESGTEITLTDADEYDAPNNPDPLSMGSMAHVWAETTITEADGDTYDNDVNVAGLDIPMASLQTDRTAMTSDTYDNDVDLTMAGVPSSDYDQTTFTRVTGETYDDDNSVENLSFPSP